MQNTSHKSCLRLVELLVDKGVEYAVVSPGSRNAPLLIALAREQRIKKLVIVDERSAAFVALGICQQTDKPVVVVCTSGTALLNYAPAVAEAYYQHLPLIVVSADRPLEWIDQNDSQTIRQDGALSNIVKRTYSLPSKVSDNTQSWYVNRTLNEAITTSLSGSRGPVHVNFHISEPICDLDEENSGLKIIDVEQECKTLPQHRFEELASKLSGAEKVMIVCGHMQPEERLNDCLNKLSKNSNVVVLAEPISNVKGAEIISRIDTVLSVVDDEEGKELAPDIMIYIGGAPVSRLLKQYLRSCSTKEQWRVGADDNIIDTMQGLTRSINCAPAEFFNGIVKHSVSCCNSRYSESWHKLAEDSYRTHSEFVDNANWCDLKAISIILPELRSGVNLQVSNGLSIRYSQLFDVEGSIRMSCNRGVSGIDGSTSTALGASIVSDNGCVLITGDMSFSYDLSGLASQYNTKKLKIIVMCNDGGGIFRFIKGPSSLPELEEYFEVNKKVPVDRYAEAFGFEYLSADDESQLKHALQEFNKNDRPTILAVHTPKEYNTEVLRNYYKRTK